MKNPLSNLGRFVASRRTAFATMFWGAYGYKSQMQRNMGQFWEYYAENEVVWAAVQETTRASSVIPQIAKRKQNGLWTPVTDDPIQARLEEPNVREDAESFASQMDTQLLVTGNAIIAEWPLPPRRSRTELGELTVLPTQNVFVELDDKTGLISRYYYDPGKTHGGPSVALLNQPPRDAIPFAPDRIIHRIYAPDPTWYQWGLSPISAASEAIEADLNITYYIREFFRMGGVPPHVFISEKALSDEQSRQIQKRWLKLMGGVFNSWKIGVVDGTKGTFQKLGLAAGSREVGLDDLRGSTELRILTAMNVPPIVVGARLGIEHATYSNYDQARIAMFEENTEPLIHRRDAAFTHYMRRRFADRNIRVEPDFTGVFAVQQRLIEISQKASRELQAGLSMRNEARVEVGKPPTPDGDIFLTPLNLVPSSEAMIPDARAQQLAAGLDNRDVTAQIIRLQALESATRLRLGGVPESVVTSIMLGMPKRGDEPKVSYARRVLFATHVAVRTYAEGVALLDG